MTIRARVEDLIRYALEGKRIEALETFYHDDVVMQENNEPPRIGLEVSLERQRQAMALSMEVHDFKAVSVLVDGNRAAIEWHAEWTMPDGLRVRVEEIALQTWKGDRIIHERFFYDTKPLAQSK